MSEILNLMKMNFPMKMKQRPLLIILLFLISLLRFSISQAQDKDQIQEKNQEFKDAILSYLPLNQSLKEKKIKTDDEIAKINEDHSKNVHDDIGCEPRPIENVH